MHLTDIREDIKFEFKRANYHLGKSKFINILNKKRQFKLNSSITDEIEKAQF